MREIVERLLAWHSDGRPYALATVIAVSGSAPRGPGASLAVSSDGEVVGSLSGGCVEGAVYDLCLSVIATGETVRERFGYSDEDAFAVGLTCGGTLDVLVQPGHTLTEPGLSALSRDEHMARVHLLDGTTFFVWPASAIGTTGDIDLDRVILAETRALLDTATTGLRTLPGHRCEGGGAGREGRTEVAFFVQSYAPAPRMLVFGAIDHAAAVAGIGAFLGYRVTVCDARPVFATAARFPHADEVIVDWPHRYLAQTTVDSRTVICVLTHDAKFDVPLLEVALRLPVAYVGAMGSRRTHDDRLRRLKEAGLTDDELAGLRSPIGLDLGARTPEETAVAIAAEIVAVCRGGTTLPLGRTTGPIHHRQHTDRWARGSTAPSVGSRVVGLPE